MTALKRVPCPAHGGHDLNVALWRDERRRLRAKCWSRGCPERQILAALDQPDWRAVVMAPPLHGAKRTALAGRIWRASRSAAGTLVEIYARARGITIPIPLSLRFHPNLKHPSGAYHPAMIAAVQNREGEIVAIHRTYLATDGRKAPVEPAKMALGPIRGGAVRLSDKLTSQLLLAEGIETAFSVLQATGIPAWAALGTSNMFRVELPDFVREVTIAADNDPSGAGEKAARKAALRFIGEGRRARIARPSRTGDFNDVLTAEDEDDGR